MADRESEEGVWPFKWCKIHFAGAVEKMEVCLVQVERLKAGVEFNEPDCTLVQRVLVDREAIYYEAAVEFARALGLCADDEIENEPEPFADQIRWVIEVAVFGETEAKGGRWLDTALGEVGDSNG